MSAFRMEKHVKIVHWWEDEPEPFFRGWGVKEKPGRSRAGEGRHYFFLRGLRGLSQYGERHLGQVFGFSGVRGHHLAPQLSSSPPFKSRVCQAPTRADRDIIERRHVAQITAVRGNDPVNRLTFIIKRGVSTRSAQKNHFCPNPATVIFGYQNYIHCLLPGDYPLFVSAATCTWRTKSIRSRRLTLFRAASDFTPPSSWRSEDESRSRPLR